MTIFQIIIVLRFAQKQAYSVLKSFAQVIHDGLNGAAAYSTPNPTLILFQTHIDAFAAAITAWGPKGNRGPHSALVALRVAAEVVRQDLRDLSRYCMDTTPNDGINFSAVGWETRLINSPIGALPGPSNLRIVRGPVFVTGRLHYRWKKVKGANAYMVWTGTGNTLVVPPDTSLPHVNVTKAEYDDVSSPPGTPRWIVVGCIGANLVTGYSGMAGQLVP